MNDSVVEKWQRFFGHAPKKEATPPAPKIPPRYAVLIGEEFGDVIIYWRQYEYVLPFDEIVLLRYDRELEELTIELRDKTWYKIRGTLGADTYTALRSTIRDWRKKRK